MQFASLQLKLSNGLKIYAGIEYSNNCYLHIFPDLQGHEQGKIKCPLGWSKGNTSNRNQNGHSDVCHLGFLGKPTAKQDQIVQIKR